jgi:hypothetical protein
MDQSLWHGAAPATALTHIAIQEQLDGVAGAGIPAFTRGGSCGN